MPNPPQTTTEEHQPPAASEAGRGQPVLLSAFPALAAVPIPPSNEVIGREWFEKQGVKDAQISNLHLRFSWVEDRLHIEDIDSKNGVYLNGVGIDVGAPVELKDGAVLRLGRTLLVYRENFSGPLSPEQPLGELVGPWGLAAVREAVAKLKPRSDLNVLIEGETGTGKELLAKVVAETVGRGGKLYECFNVSAFSASMFAGELFGSKKGSYTGALSERLGIIRAYSKGTVLLDEFGELPPEMQPALLRLLQTREIQPVGEDHPVKVDVVLIAATNCDLEAKVEEGTFRRDLLARFPVRLELTPLRDRPEDIFAILQELRKKRKAPLDPKAVEVEAVERLMLEDLPANVRDLERIAELMDLQGVLRHAAVKRALRKTRKTSAARKRKAAPRTTFPVAATPRANLQPKKQ